MARPLTVQDIKRTASGLGLSISSDKAEEILDELENNPRANEDTIVEMLKRFSNGRSKALAAIQNLASRVGVRLSNRYQEVWHSGSASVEKTPNGKFWALDGGEVIDESEGPFDTLNEAKQAAMEEQQRSGG